MSVLLDCKGCTFKKMVPSKYAGTKVKCPECGTVNYISITVNSQKGMKEFKVMKPQDYLANRPETVESSRHQAQTLSRILAYFIDLFIFLKLPYTFICLMFFIFNFITEDLLRSIYDPLLFIFGIFYFHYYTVKRFGQTPGSRLMGIQVRTEDGDEIDFNPSIVRGLVLSTPLLFFPFIFLGLLTIFGKKHKSLADYVSDTWVSEIRVLNKKEKARNFFASSFVYSLFYFFITLNFYSMVGIYPMRILQQEFYKDEMKKDYKIIAKKLDPQFNKIPEECKPMFSGHKCYKYEQVYNLNQAITSCMKENDIKECYLASKYISQLYGMNLAESFLKYACLSDRNDRDCVGY